MKIMVLGSGPNQQLGIVRLRAAGHFVVACDYNRQSVGKALADAAALADVFSYRQTLAAASSHAVDALVVFATDQPVLTAARVSEALALPYHLSAAQARLFTDKLAMKQLFKTAEVVQLDYCEVAADWQSSDLIARLPLVVKPVDSQGQRGVSLVATASELAPKIELARAHSRSGRVLAERYYPNREVAVSGWVKDGVCHILTMTDRVTFEDVAKLGICVSHEHPSSQAVQHGAEITALTRRITALTGIVNGPIYYQFLIGAQGVVVNEIAARIGGAHEDVAIKALTGFDILEAQINLTTGRPVDCSMLAGYDYLANQRPLSVQLFFAKPGKLAQVVAPRARDWLLKFGLHYRVGDVIPATENASARAGYAVIVGADEVQLGARIAIFYDELKLLDEGGASLLIEGKRGYR